MTTQQPEALRLADALERPGYGWHSTPAQCAAELRRQYAELETLRTGYEAARLEIESLRGKGWQPLITAPLNEIVLVAAEFDGPGDWRIKCGDLDERTGKWHVFGASWEPTHWMPLPAAPGPADGESNG